MVAYFTAPVRVLLLIAVLALSTQHVEAARPTAQSPAPAARADKRRPADADDAVDGWLILAGVVGVVVFVAWLASRFGDNRSHIIN